MTQRPIILAAALAILAGPAPAQDQPDPAPTPETTSHDEPAPAPAPPTDASPLEEPPSSGRVYRAADADRTLPGIILPDYRPARGAVLPEGTYIRGRRGIVVPLPDERWAFVFDPHADDERDPPMHLMPGLRLAEMIRLVQTSPETITFFIDGEVFVYNNTNHLLPNFYETASAESLSREETIEAAIEANEQLAASDDAEPSVDDLMARLEQADKREPERSITPMPSGSHIDDVVPEQTMVVSRRGRLSRSGPLGQWTFMPENDTDPDPEGATATPLILMPCLNTQEMERLAETHADRVVFIVSGSVFVFEGRNHLLPSMYLIEHARGHNLLPGQ